MRHVITFSIFALILNVTMFTNYSYAQETVNEKEIKGTIGYLDGLQDFIPIDDAQLTKLMHKIFPSAENLSFGPATISVLEDDSQGPTYYLNISSTDGLANIKSRLADMGNGQFAITGKANCLCWNTKHSTGISNIVMKPGGSCKCTSNDSKKEKITMSTSPGYIEDFFARRY